MRHLKAFTLIELLVAMAVSGIVIAGGYVSYGMINRNYIDFRNHTDATNQVVAMQGILSHDFAVSIYVKRYSSDEIAIAKNDSEIVSYQWSENYVLRKKLIAQDTFFVPVKKAEMRFCDSSQTGSGGLIDGLILTSGVKGQEFIFYFDKQYGSDVFMQNENLNNGRH